MKIITVALAAMLAFAGLAHAQTPDTSVGLSAIVDFLLPIVLTIVTTIIGILLPVLITAATRKFNLQIEQEKRDALQVTLTNAAGGLVQQLGDRARDLKIDVKDPRMADAVRRVTQGAPDALRWAGLNEAEIARRVLEKIPMIVNTTVPPVEPIAKL